MESPNIAVLFYGCMSHCAVSEPWAELKILCSCTKPLQQVFICSVKRILMLLIHGTDMGEGEQSLRQPSHMASKAPEPNCDVNTCLFWSFPVIFHLCHKKQKLKDFCYDPALQAREVQYFGVESETGKAASTVLGILLVLTSGLSQPIISP